MPDQDQNALPCVDKIAFDEKKEAEAAAVVAHYQHGVRLKPYICPYCDLWHLATDYV